VKALTRLAALPFGLLATVSALPALAATLAALTIGAPVTAQTTAPLQFKDGTPANVVIQGKFAYGSGGSAVSAWVQTTFDGGQTWTDLCNFSFTTTSARTVANLSALTVVGSPIPATDGTMGANVCVGTLIGSQWRVKYTTTGTYVGTSLAIDVQSQSRLGP
jgi:hypothetical protein